MPSAHSLTTRGIRHRRANAMRGCVNIVRIRRKFHAGKPTQTIYGWLKTSCDGRFRLETFFARDGKFSSRRNFFWHMSCITLCVARKFHASGMVRNAVDSAALNLRMATMQLAGLRIPPRVRTVPTLRRRLPVTFVPESAQPVIMRHASQNLGSPVTETQPTQSPRV